MHKAESTGFRKRFTSAISSSIHPARYYKCRPFPRQLLDTPSQNPIQAAGRQRQRMSKVQKAWFYRQYGSLDVLQFGDFPLPTPGPGEVLVKVKAAALNPVDFIRRQGAFGDHDSNFTTVPGCDVSGVVEEVGEGVSKFSKGDHVYGDIFDKPKQWGTLAQYTAAHEKLFALKPSNLSFEEAASLPLALQTAQQPFEFVNFQKGQTVFIVGGAGGVGTLAIQVAKHIYGASRIVATASTPKLDFVKSLGADEAVDYTKQSYEQIPEKFDFVFDTIGDSFKSHVLAKEGAKIIDIATFPAHPKATNFRRQTDGSNLERVREYIESGTVKAVLDPKSPFGFSEVIEAFKLQESGRARGKIVISPIE